MVKVCTSPFRIDSEGKRILQCHSKGDKRFSPFCCFVSAFGIFKSIENHYQCAKVFEEMPPPRDWRDAKQYKKDGIKQIGWKIGNLPILPVTLVESGGFAIEDWGVQFYLSLWYKYLRSNSKLIAIAREFDAFEDPFEGNFPFSQARVFELVSCENVEAIRPMCQPLFDLILSQERNF